MAAEFWLRRNLVPATRTFDNVRDQSADSYMRRKSNEDNSASKFVCFRIRCSEYIIAVS
jgi:hypothetical protein